MEKRKHERIAIEKNISVVVLPKIKVKPLPKLLDISFEGARIETMQQFNTGEEIDILVTLPDGSEIKIESEIIWEEKKAQIKYYGVKFRELSSKQKKLLGEFINQQLLKLVRPGKEKNIEKRKHQRINIDVSLVYIKKENISEPIKGYITDISLGGMKMASSLDIPEGENIYIEFPFNDLVVFKLSGQITRKKSEEGYFAYGIMFIPESEDQKAKLKNYIQLKIK